MQSNNQVVILGINNFDKSEKQTVWPTKLEKTDGHPTFLLPPGLCFYNALEVSSPKVDLVEVSILYKLEKTSSPPLSLKKI